MPHGTLYRHFMNSYAVATSTKEKLQGGHGRSISER